MILVIDKEGRRLCKDNKWRSFAHFGTTSWCVKEYKSLGFAKRRAKRNGGQVVIVPEGMVVEAGGRIYEENLGQRGEQSWKSFVV